MWVWEKGGRKSVFGTEELSKKLQFWTNRSVVLRFIQNLVLDAEHVRKNVELVNRFFQQKMICQGAWQGCGQFLYFSLLCTSEDCN